MKKILSLMLVLSMVLGSFGLAFAAPADVVGTDYENAVKRLVALGVITGYEDGSFKPDNTITRAEFAAIAVRTLGLEAAAKVSGGSTMFTDTEGHWATGYINIASGQKIVNGYPDGTFKPNAPVKFEEAITMLVRTLGYEPAVTGGYPAGYLAKAAELEISDDVKGSVGTPAVRGIVAQLTDNSLEVELMERQTWGDEANYEPVDKTLLENKIGVEIIKGSVEAFDEDDKEVTIAGEDYDYVDVNFEGLVNSTVVAWEISGDIVYVDVDSEIVYDFVVELQDEDGEEVTNLAQVEKIKLEGGKTYKLNDDVTLPTGLEADDFAKVILNDSKIANLERYAVGEAGIITSVEEDILEYAQANSNKKIRDLDEADEIIVIINGEKAEYSELETGMYFDFVEYDTDEFILVATDKVVMGELERVRWSDSEIKVDGTYYDLAANAYVSDDDGDDYETAAEDKFDSLFDEEIKVVLNNKGDVAYVSADLEDDTTTFYGFVTAVDDFADKVKIDKVVDGDMENITYDFDDSEVTPAVDAALMNNFFEFEVDEDNKVVAMKSSVFGSTGITIEAFSDSNDTMTDSTDKYYYVDSDVKIFDVTDTNDIEVYTWDEIEGTSLNATDNLTVSVDGVNVKLMVITATNGDASLGSGNDFEFGFVLDRSRVSSSKFEYEIMTQDGKITVEVSDSATAEADAMVAYELTSDDEADIVAESVYGDMATVADESSDWTDGTGTVDAGTVDGDMITISGTEYKVASDAIIYEAVASDDFDEADLSDINDDDNSTNVSYIVENGLIKVLFFWR